MAKSLTLVFKNKITTAIALLVMLLIIGVVGFKVMSDYSWVDAFYMTVITITTVGFGEVNPLDTQSKIFTIFLILTSVVIVGYALSVITEYILANNNAEELKQKRMQKQIDALKNHVIICGYGRNGKQAAKKLMIHKRNFVVIENNEEVVNKHQSDMVPMVLGNANEDETLKQAGLERAQCLIVALPSDADNVFVVLTARQVNPNIRIISRASRETTYGKLKLAGANNVILPDKIGGDHMASLVVVPDLVEFIDNISVVDNENPNIEQVDVVKLLSDNKAVTIRELDLRKKTGCNIIGYKSANGNYLINPEANQLLEPDAKIIVLGRIEQIQKLNSLYDIDI